MTDLAAQKRQQVLDTYLEDYRAREAETLKLMDMTHPTFIYSATLVGVFFAAAKFIYDEESLHFLFGLFPVFLYFSCMAQLKYMFVVAAHDKYLKDTLCPNVVALLNSGDQHPVTRTDQVLAWKRGINSSAYSMRWHDFPLDHVRVLMPLICGLSIFILYVVVTKDKCSPVFLTLSVINGVLFLYCAIKAFAIIDALVKFLRRNPYQNSKAATKENLPGPPGSGRRGNSSAHRG